LLEDVEGLYSFPSFNGFMNEPCVDGVETASIHNNSKSSCTSTVPSPNCFTEPIPLDENNGEINEMEQELESILQELGMDEQESVEESEEMYEADDEESKPAKKDKPAAPKSEKPAAAPGADEFGEEEAEEVGELTVDEFTSIVRSAVQDAMGGGAGDEMGMDAGMEPEMDDMGGDPSLDGMDADMGGDDLGGAEGEEELDLDELIAELSNEQDVNEGEELEEGEDIDENEEVNEGEELEESEDLEEGEDLDEAAKKAFFEKGRAKGGKVGKPFAQGKPGFQKAPTGKTKKMSEVTSQELQEAVKKAFFEKGRAKGGKVGKPFAQGKPGFQKAPTGKTKKMSEATETQLQEAVNTIKSLKTTLKETNLLNAKLLFVNKLFKAKQLNEVQKVKVIAAFDKARTRDEANVIYNSLNETLNKKKSLVKENLGFASKTIMGVKPQAKNLIVEDATVARFKKLAGII